LEGLTPLFPIAKISTSTSEGQKAQRRKEMNNAQAALNQEFKTYLDVIQQQMLTGLISYAEMEQKQLKAQSEHNQAILKMQTKENYLDQLISDGQSVVCPLSRLYHALWRYRFIP
jgi:glutamyl-tRNA reductase